MFSPAAAQFAAAVAVVNRGPGTFFSFFVGNAVFFVALLNVTGHSFLVSAK